ncbi:transposase [Geopseudomonas aromaticivorans]
MPCKQRMYLPGLPAHVVQRGSNRSACFFLDDDYRFYLAVLGEAVRLYWVALHAYVLMTNQVHLLMMPVHTDGVSWVMQHVGRMYVLYINRTYRRSATLWEGRHKASLVNAAEYQLTCYRYIELNLVRAGMVEVPDDYPWSSYRRHGWGETNPLVTDHPLYLALGKDGVIRQQTYRQLFTGHLELVSLQVMRESLAHNYPLGNDRFRESIEKQLGYAVGHRTRGSA